MPLGVLRHVRMRVHELRFAMSVLLVLGLIVVSGSLPAAAAEGDYLAPAWIRTLGGAGNDQGWGIDIGPDGEVYVAGFVLGQGLDIYVARLDPSGNPVWITQRMRPFDQKAFEVRYADGFVYLGGVAARSGSPTSQDMFLSKLWSENGTAVWETTWNGPADQYDEIDGIVVEDGLVFVSGWADVQLDYSEGDLAILAFTLDGAYVRHALWGGSGREEANGALVSDGLTLYVGGIVDGVNLFAGGDAVVVAFNRTTLAEVWNTTWGGAAVDDAYGLAIHADRLYATGLTTSFGGDRIFLLTLDTDGTLLRNETWGGAGAEAARAVGVSPNGSAVYVAGRTSSYGNGSFDVVLLEFDGTGAYKSYRTWGGSASDVSHGILVTSDSIFLAGETGGQGYGGTDLFAMKVGPGGSSGPTTPPSPPPNVLAGVVIVVIAVGFVGVLILVVRSRRRRTPPPVGPSSSR